MRGKISRFISGLFFSLIFARSCFYLGSKLYFEQNIDGYDWIVVPIGLVSLYLSYMYFKKIFQRTRNKGKSTP